MEAVNENDMSNILNHITEVEGKIVIFSNPEVAGEAEIVDEEGVTLVPVLAFDTLEQLKLYVAQLHAHIVMLSAKRNDARKALLN